MSSPPLNHTAKEQLDFDKEVSLEAARRVVAEERRLAKLKRREADKERKKAQHQGRVGEPSSSDDDMERPPKVAKGNEQDDAPSSSGRAAAAAAPAARSPSPTPLPDLDELFKNIGSNVKVKTTSSSTVKHILTYSFELEGMADATNKTLTSDEIDFGVTGTWNIELQSHMMNPGEYTVVLKCAGSSVGALGLNPSIKYSFTAIEPGKVEPVTIAQSKVTELSNLQPATYSTRFPELRIARGRFTSSPSGVSLDYKAFKKYEISVELEVKSGAEDSRSFGTELARRMTASSTSQIPQDVRLVFQLDDKTLDLWSSSKALTIASPTLMKLLKTSTARTHQAHLQKLAKAAIEDDLDDVVIEDSGEMSEGGDDFEAIEFKTDADAVMDLTYGNRLKSAPQPLADLKYHTIEINDFAYSTYKAVFVWISTGHIAFAPLTSLNHRLVRSAAGVGTSSAFDFILANPRLPFPVCPKSVYTLAHHLEMNDLKQLAFDNYKAQLSEMNVALEMFDQFNEFSEVAELTLEVAAKHWEKVKKSELMGEIRDMAKEGRVKRYAEVCEKLLWRT